MATASYVIGIGSNRRHVRHGAPARIVAAAVCAIAAQGLTVVRCSRTRRSPALGPSARDFANAALLVDSALPPLALLALLKRIERDFGRRRGRRWGARVLDLDILAWSLGRWHSRTLVVRTRRSPTAASRSARPPRSRPTGGNRAMAARCASSLRDFVRHDRLTARRAAHRDGAPAARPRGPIAQLVEQRTFNL